MAVAKPIISSDLPVIREILRHEENALLVEPENIERWINTIKSLHKNQDLRTRLAKQAYQDLSEHYTWEKRAVHIIKFCVQSE